MERVVAVVVLLVDFLVDVVVVVAFVVVLVVVFVVDFVVDFVVVLLVDLVVDLVVDVDFLVVVVLAAFFVVLTTLIVVGFSVVVVKLVEELAALKHLHALLICATLTPGMVALVRGLGEGQHLLGWLITKRMYVLCRVERAERGWVEVFILHNVDVGGTASRACRCGGANLGAGSRGLGFDTLASSESIGRIKLQEW